MACMNSCKLFGFWTRRSALPALVALLTTMCVNSSALSVSQFAPVRELVAGEIDLLAALPDPTRRQQNRLRTLLRASEVLNDLEVSNGKGLRSLLRVLKGKSFLTYRPALETTGTNLVALFNRNHQFVASVLPEMPPSPAADAATAQFNALTPILSRLNAAGRASKVATLLDASDNRLFTAFALISQALIVPYPAEIGPDSVAANINGVNFRVSVGFASENLFEAVTDGTNIAVTCSAIDGTISGRTAARGLLFCMPQMQPGTARYNVPASIVFTNRLGVYSGSETNVAATEGAFFISSSPDEVYGVFSCSGPGFTIKNGRFRISLSRTE